MRHRFHLFSRGGLISTFSLAWLAIPLVAHGETLYTLKTRCSLQGAAPVPCTVEASDGGGGTLYRHLLGAEVETIRISDKPVRMERWDHAAKQWRPLKTASARFSANTVCFNGADLCVINPNYLNSVREENAAATAGRDLVKVHFGADGRINASCYDDGCEVSLR
jgi:hypothetical protein